MTGVPSDRAGRVEVLAQRARGGDGRALEDLLAEIRPLVAARCSRILPCREDADEAIQDALLTVATKLDSYRGTGTFLGWVGAIATNAARSTYRSLKARSAEFAVERLPEPANPRTTSVIAGSRLDLLDALEELEKEHPSYVEAFVLRDLGTLPYQDIADHLDVPIGTVKARVHHARAYVRGRLG